MEHSAAEVEIEASTVAQTVSLTVPELPRSQLQVIVPSTVQQEEERRSQQVEEAAPFSEEAFGDDPANYESAGGDSPDVEASDGRSPSNPIDLDPPAVTQTPPSAPQVSQMQVLSSAPQSAGQHNINTVAPPPVASSNLQGGQQARKRPGKGAWSWENRRGPRPPTVVLTPYDFVRDKQAYLQNQANYDKAHKLIAKCPFKYGCDTGPFSTRIDGKDDFVAIITLNHLNKHRKTIPAYQDLPAPNGHRERKEWYDRYTSKSERDDIRVFVMEKVEEEIAKTHPKVWNEVQRLRQPLPVVGGQLGASAGMGTMIPQLAGGFQSVVAGGQSGGGAVSGPIPRAIAPSRGSRRRNGGGSDMNSNRQYPNMSNDLAGSQQERKRRREMKEEYGDDEVLKSMSGPPQEKKLKSDSGLFGGMQMGHHNFSAEHNNALGLQDNFGGMFAGYPALQPNWSQSTGAIEGGQPNRMGQMEVGYDAQSLYPALQLAGQGASHNGYGLPAQGQYPVDSFGQFVMGFHQQGYMTGYAGYTSDFGDSLYPGLGQVPNTMQQFAHQYPYQDSMIQPPLSFANGAGVLPSEHQYGYPDPTTAGVFWGSLPAEGMESDQSMGNTGDHASTKSGPNSSLGQS